MSSRGWWFDEALTVVEIRLDLAEMLRQLSLQEHTPPLYFVLANGWASIAGVSGAGVRSFSAALGVGTVWLAWVVAARLVSIRAGLVAAALAAGNPMLVWFSLEARAYSLLTMLGGWSFLSFMEARERPRGRALAAWLIASALALWTHYFAIFLVGPEALWLLLRHPRSRAVRASLLGLALGVPMLMTLLPHLDVMMSRYLAATTIPVLVVIAAGLGARRGGALAATTVALTCVLGIAIDLGTASVSKFEHEDWRGAARAMGPTDGVRALVLTPARGALPPRPLSPLPEAPFEIVERMDADSFTLVRYRAATPVSVDRARLAALRLGPEDAVVLLESPGAATNDREIEPQPDPRRIRKGRVR